MLSALLGLRNGNDLGLAGARRDKGLMKVAVANAGLRVAKYARLTRSDGGEVVDAIKELELDFPVVVKTPRGWSTQDVYICNTMEEAIESSSKIVKSLGPDGRKTQYALLEEFLEGDEFAVNLIASPTTPRGVQVTDVWMYHKVNMYGTMVNTWQSQVDPHDKKYASLVRYAEGVCRAVGIKYGMAHIELKATFDEKVGRWTNPAMIEVGARMAGGRKSVMAEATVNGWHPFAAMVDAHCGFPVLIPPSFRPEYQALHVYIPSDKNGIVTKMEGEDFERLPTYYAHSLIAAVGKQVKQSKELASFAAHLWLIGEPEDVERDAKRARAEFNVEVDPIPEEGSDKIDEKTGTPSTVSPATVAAV
jgi:biotin carboxylase